MYIIYIIILLLFLQFKKNVRSKVKSFPPDSAPDEKAKKTITHIFERNCRL